MNWARICLIISLFFAGVIYAKQLALPGVLLFGGIGFAFALGAVLFGWQAYRERHEKRYGQNGNVWRSRPFRRR